jgi:hypothetical protein
LTLLTTFRHCWAIEGPTLHHSQDSLDSVTCLLAFRVPVGPPVSESRVAGDSSRIDASIECLQRPLWIRTAVRVILSDKNTKTTQEDAKEFARYNAPDLITKTVNSLLS